MKTHIEVWWRGCLPIKYKITNCGEKLLTVNEKEKENKK